LVHRTQSIIHSWLSTVASRKWRKIEDETINEECIKQQRRQWNIGKTIGTNAANKQQQQSQKQDGEQVEEDEPQTGTMTHHNELPRKGTKTVHSNLICKLVMKESFKVQRIFGRNSKCVI
jgi:hypothetical protein